MLSCTRFVSIKSVPSPSTMQTSYFQPSTPAPQWPKNPPARECSKDPSQVAGTQGVINAPRTSGHMTTVPVLTAHGSPSFSDEHHDGNQCRREAPYTYATTIDRHSGLQLRRAAR